MKRRQRGFTLIEASIIIVVLALMAVLAVPYVGRSLASQRAASFKLDVLRLFKRAKELSVSQGEKHVVRFTGSEFVITAEPLTVAPNTGAGKPLESNIQNTDSDGLEEGQTRVGQLSLAEGVSVDQFWMNDEVSDQGTWAASFYPNGTASKAGLEISANGAVYWIRVNTERGTVDMGEGAFPQGENTRWEAGNIEQRISQ